MFRCACRKGSWIFSSLLPIFRYQRSKPRLDVAALDLDDEDALPRVEDDEVCFSLHQRLVCVSSPAPEPRVGVKDHVVAGELVSERDIDVLL
jgi:hypothetical protein